MNIFTVLLIQPLINGLAISYKLLGGNMGLAIIGFSIFLRLALTPLTRPYMESMKRMKEFAPQIAKLKKKHKGDKKKEAEAISQFYKEKGINPGAGCLPYILQIVILFALYDVFIRVLKAENIAAINSLLYEPLKFSETTQINTNFLYLNLVNPDLINTSLLPFAIPGAIVILAALFQFVSAKMASPYIEAQEKMAKRSKDEKDDIQVAMQNSMVYTMPLMTIFIGTRFPAGLALYWLIFSIYQAVQQYYSSGWGGLTPWLRRAGLLKSGTQ